MIVNRAELELIAEGMLGIPYAPDGADPATGLHCGGVVAEFYRRAGRPGVYKHISECNAADVLGGQAWLDWREIPAAEADSGDLVVFCDDAGRPLGHIGIFLYPCRVLHAKAGALGVAIQRVDPRRVGMRILRHAPRPAL